jgi:hypothetical protein
MERKVIQHLISDEEKWKRQQDVDNFNMSVAHTANAEVKKAAEKERKEKVAQSKAAERAVSAAVKAKKAATKAALLIQREETAKTKAALLRWHAEAGEKRKQVAEGRAVEKAKKEANEVERNAAEKEAGIARKAAATQAKAEQATQAKEEKEVEKKRPKFGWEHKLLMLSKPPSYLVDKKERIWKEFRKEALNQAPLMGGDGTMYTLYRGTPLLGVKNFSREELKSLVAPKNWQLRRLEAPVILDAEVANTPAIGTEAWYALIGDG